MLPSLLLPPSLCPGLGGRRDGGEGAGSQGMGGALVLQPLELALPPARGEVGGAGFPVLLWAAVLGEEGVGLGGLGGGLSSSPSGWTGRSVESVPLHWLWCSGSVSLPGMRGSPTFEFLLVTEWFLD